MAYKKKYNKSSKYSGSRRWRNYRRGATQLYRDVMMLKGLINVEKKFIDNTISASAISSTGATSLMNGVAQGTDNINRVGDSIKMVSIMIEGYVTLHASATSDYIRLALVLDKQPNAALGAYTDIYQTSTPQAPRHYLTVDRYVVLKEFRLDLDSNGKQLAKFSHYTKIPVNSKDHHVKFNGTGATIGSIYTNSLLLAVCGTQATNTSTLNAIVRIRFVDN